MRGQTRLEKVHGEASIGGRVAWGLWRLWRLMCVLFLHSGFSRKSWWRCWRCCCHWGWPVGRIEARALTRRILRGTTPMPVRGGECRLCRRGGRAFRWRTSAGWLAIVLGSCGGYAAAMVVVGAAMGLAALYLRRRWRRICAEGCLRGAPTVIAVWFAVLAVIRRVRGLSRPVQAALAPAVLIIAAISMAGGCAAAGGARKALAAQSMIERVECRLSAEADNVEAVYRLRIAATGAADFALLDASAVLTSSPRPAPGVTIRTEGGRHVVAVEKAVDVYTLRRRLRARCRRRARITSGGSRC